MGASLVTDDGFGDLSVTDGSFGASPVTDDGIGVSSVTEDCFWTSSITDDGLGASTVTDDYFGDTYPFLSSGLPPIKMNLVKLRKTNTLLLPFFSICFLL